MATGKKRKAKALAKKRERKPAGRKARISPEIIWLWIVMLLAMLRGEERKAKKRPKRKARKRAGKAKAKRR